MVAKGFGIVTMAARAMSMTLLTNPITWIVLAIAGAAFLIYKNWAAISGFFSGIWTTIKTAFNGGIKGISALIINWSPIGLFYSAFAKVLSWFGVDLPAKFTDFGAMILDGLKNGIMSRVAAVKEAISGAVSGVIEKPVAFKAFIHLHAYLWALVTTPCKVWPTVLSNQTTSPWLRLPQLHKVWLIQLSKLNQ